MQTMHSKLLSGDVDSCIQWLTRMWSDERPAWHVDHSNQDEHHQHSYYTSAVVREEKGQGGEKERRWMD